MNMELRCSDNLWKHHLYIFIAIYCWCWPRANKNATPCFKRIPYDLTTLHSHFLIGRMVNSFALKGVVQSSDFQLCKAEASLPEVNQHPHTQKNKQNLTMNTFLLFRKIIFDENTTQLNSSRNDTQMNYFRMSINSVFRGMSILNSNTKTTRST